MVDGEKNFTTDGQRAVRFESTPVPTADYELKLVDNFEIRKKAEPGAMPYIAARFELLGTGKDGGKNRLLFHNFMVSLDPGRDGVLNPARANQLTGYAQALGEAFKTGRIVEVTNKAGGKTNCIDPRAVVEWLKAKAGSITKAHVKVKPAKDGYDAKNEVAYFIPAEEEGTKLPDGFGNTTESKQWTPEGEA